MNVLKPVLLNVEEYPCIDGTPVQLDNLLRRCIVHEEPTKDSLVVELTIFGNIQFHVMSKEKFAKYQFEMPDNNKLSKEYIEGLVDQSSVNITHTDTMTLYHVRTKEGADIVGQAHVIDPNNNIPKYGEEAACNNVIDQLWELEGYFTLRMLDLMGANPRKIESYKNAGQ